MSQDYKKTSNRSSKKQQAKSNSPLPTFLFGMVFGALLMNFAPALLKTAPTATTAVKDVTETVKAEASELKFDFYTLLKNTEIIVPNDEPSNNQNIEPKENSSYLLQAGSFKNANDAEALRVKLLLLNLSANIETVNLGNGEKWHRVLVGPFTDSSSLAYARAKLAENAIDIVLLKRKL
jgi:cell division protein FtsN|tara:strand:+ start:7763 stop:8299 length:537 start_codon:yes stop_codon:yes gene_type:complete